MKELINIQKIQSILNDDSIFIKEEAILNCIAESPHAIDVIIKLIGVERNENTRLISEMNLELSRAEVHILHPTLASGSNYKELGLTEEEASKEFVLNNIIAFYHRWKHRVRHQFNKNI